MAKKTTKGTVERLLGEQTLVMFSGGIDSTAALWYVLNRPKEFPKVHVHHIHIDNVENRWRAEAKATNDVLKYVKDHLNVSYTYSESVIATPRVGNNFLFDTEILSFVSGYITSRDKSFTKIVTGATGTDFEMTANDSIKRAIPILDAFYDGKVGYGESMKVRPLKDISKKQAYELVPAELAALTWSCRTPIYVDGVAYECGICKTCVKEMKGIKRPDRRYKGIIVKRSKSAGTKEVENPKVRTLVMFSGGLDSTATLWYMFQHPKQYPNIHIHHIHIHNVENRWRAEAKSVDNILNYFREHTNVPFTYDESTIATPRIGNKFLYDSEVISFISGYMTSRDDTIKKVIIGATATDFAMDAPQAVGRGKLLHNAFHPDVEDHSALVKEYPLQDMTKKEVYEYLPADLAALTWSCRTPRYINGIPVECGLCKTCKKEMKGINRLTRMRR